MLEPMESPLFSELIDRWFEAGDRLDELARPAATPDTWQTRARGLAARVLDKHRLEVLVAVGLLPLMLFLFTQGTGHRAVAPNSAALMKRQDARNAIRNPQ